MTYPGAAIPTPDWVDDPSNPITADLMQQKTTDRFNALLAAIAQVSVNVQVTLGNAVGNYTQDITFPTGLFTTTPVLQCTVVAGSPNLFNVGYVNASPTGATIVVYHASTTSGVANVSVTARPATQ